MFSLDSHSYLSCKYIALNTLSKYDTALRLSTLQITVWLCYKVTHTAELNKVFTVINPFISKIKVHLSLSLPRLILNVIPDCHFGSFCKTFHLILARSPFSKEGENKTIILIATDTH